MFATLLGPLPPDIGRDAGDPAGDPTDGPDDPDAPILAAIQAQEAAGLDLVGDGFAAAGPTDDPDHVAARWRRAAEMTTRTVKATIVGPWSAGAAADGGDDPVAHLRGIVEALANAGCSLVEVDEPAATSIADDAAERTRFGELHRALTDGIAGRIHLSLALTGGNVEALGARTLFDLPYASYAFDLIAGPDNWRLVAQAPGDRGIICGALDPSAAADDRPEVLVWAAHYAASTGGRGLVRVGIANASSLAALSPERARRKLVALGEAARLAAVGSSDELAAALDPRAVDIRSAAVGRYTPGNRRPGGE
ncbi:MAG TPA: hypothetical protein VFO78_07060 [Candidatus Limnocylindrales bacterium]|nr:hypothetical protein [Candidatus Limnocylindrales bacterium]